MKRILIPLIVILNPYSGLDYEEPILYEYKKEKKLEIVETLGDGYEKEEPKHSSITEIYIPQYIYPPQYINFPSY